VQRLLQQARACGKMREIPRFTLLRPDWPEAMTAQPLSPVRSMGVPMVGQWLTPVLQMAAMASGNWPLAPRPARSRWTCYPRIATRRPGTDASCVSMARDFTTATLRRWEMTGRADDVVTVVSELLTNALRHALAPGPDQPRWPIRLGLLQPGDCVLCAVADPSGKVPVPQEPDLFTEGGRGLHIVAGLSDLWGVTTASQTGKVVWAMFSAPPWPPPAGQGRWPAQAAGA